MQFLFAMLVFIASWLVFQLFALFSGLLIYGVGLHEVTSVILNPATPVQLAFLKYLQTVMSLGMFAVSALVTAYCINNRPLHFLGLDRAPETGIFLLVALLVLLSLPLNNYLTYINNKLSFGGNMQWLQDYIVKKESSVNGLMEKFLGVSGVIPLLVNIFVIAVVPAIGEELLFRGIAQSLFVKWIRNVHAGIFLTALLFRIFPFPVPVLPAPVLPGHHLRLSLCLDRFTLGDDIRTLHQ